MSTQPSLAADCWFLSGPTASGKTSVALALAPRIGAEIVSLDSMALYRGMEIGTAKPSLAERAAVPHHLLDVIDPDEEYSLAQYVAAAHRAVDDIRSRGQSPLFVGGTPLYLKSLLRGIFEGPPADWELRRGLQELARNEGSQVLHARLAQVDPISASRLHPRDTRRIIRALEVWEKTGQSITALQQQFDRARPPDACRVFVLQWPRAELAARIDARVDAMFEAGLVDEVRGLLTGGRRFSRTASQAVGYREVIEHLQGVRDLADTVALTKLRTRQLAKRQMTWFRSLCECRLVAVGGSVDVASLAARIKADAEP
ncbi:MAG: tRNA (adenosine(37)-N6)-dimethylallyltransferase MiaA [Pirellulales bacterium]